MLPWTGAADHPESILIQVPDSLCTFWIIVFIVTEVCRKLWREDACHSGLRFLVLFSLQKAAVAVLLRSRESSLFQVSSDGPVQDFAQHFLSPFL